MGVLGFWEKRAASWLSCVRKALPTVPVPGDSSACGSSFRELPCQIGLGLTNDGDVHMLRSGHGGECLQRSFPEWWDEAIF